MRPRTAIREAVAAAVALLTREALCPDDMPREDVLGGEDPAMILAAMEPITASILRMGWPEDGGAGVLSRVGLALADLDAG